MKNLKKDYPDNLKKSEGTLINYMGENDLKNLKTEIPSDYQKPVDTLKKKDFFSKLKNK